jgi:hypothetical protein
MRFVELVAQAGDPAPGDLSSVTLHPPGARFGRFHLLRDLVDVSVQRLQQFPCLSHVGIIGHVGIIAPTITKRAAKSAEQTA